MCSELATKINPQVKYVPNTKKRLQQRLLKVNPKKVHFIKFKLDGTAANSVDERGQNASVQGSTHM